jgi:hypothetical protein
MSLETASALRHLMKMRRLCLSLAIAGIVYLANGGSTAMSASGTGGSPTESKLDTARKNKVLIEVPKAFGTGQKIDPADWKDFVRAQNDDLKTGPGIGERVPDFELADQNGKQWALKQLMGANGLLLVFTRSADW